MSRERTDALAVQSLGGIMSWGLGGVCGGGRGQGLLVSPHDNLPPGLLEHLEKG